MPSIPLHYPSISAVQNQYSTKATPPAPAPATLNPISKSTQDPAPTTQPQLSQIPSPLIHTPYGRGLALLEIQGTLKQVGGASSTSTSNSVELASGERGKGRGEEAGRETDMDVDHGDVDAVASTVTQTKVGRLVFPGCKSGENGQGGGGGDEGKNDWMKPVYLYVGKHQRLTGQVKRLDKPVAVLGKKRMKMDKVTKRRDGDGDEDGMDMDMRQDQGEGEGEEGATAKTKMKMTADMSEQNQERQQEQGVEELEILDIIRFKILFASRPEPVDE